MAYDTRFARLLHVLVHMHLRGGTTTSGTLAQMLHTNEVVVRRTMAALRTAGMVTSTGGRKGGLDAGTGAGHHYGAGCVRGHRPRRGIHDRAG